MVDKRHTELGQLWLHSLLLLLSEQHLLLSPLIKWGKRTSSWLTYPGHFVLQMVQTFGKHFGQKVQRIQRIRKQKPKMRLKFKKHYFLKYMTTYRIKMPKNFSFLKGLNLLYFKNYNIYDYPAPTYCWLNTMQTLYILSCLCI